MTNKIFTAVLALSLLSCSKSVNEETISDSQLINFGTYAGLSDSRALDKDKFVGTDKIAVSAFHHKADLNGQVFVDNFFKNYLSLHKVLLMQHLQAGLTIALVTGLLALTNVFHL